MKIRHIKHKKVEPIMYAVEHEIEYKEPTIITGSSSKPFLMLTGKYLIDKYLKTKEIPTDLEIIRVPVPDEVEAGVFYCSQDVLKIDLYLPPNTIGTVELERALLANVIKALKIQKLNIILRKNDLLFKKGNKLRKFASVFKCKLINDWDFYAINVSFEMDYDLMNKVYRLDTKKMKEKGDIKDMKDIVIGIDEFKVGVDKEKFLDRFVFNLAQRFDLEVSRKDFARKELQRIDEIFPVLSSKDWTYDAKQYNSKIKQ